MQVRVETAYKVYVCPGGNLLYMRIYLITNLKLLADVAELRNMTQERETGTRTGTGNEHADLDGNRVGKPDSSCLLESNLLEWIERVI